MKYIQIPGSGSYKDFCFEMYWAPGAKKQKFKFVEMPTDGEGKKVQVVGNSITYWRNPDKENEMYYRDSAGTRDQRRFNDLEQKDHFKCLECSS